MNVVFVLLIVIAAMLTTQLTQSDQMGVHLDSLCIMSGETCHRDDAVKPPKSAKELDGFYCFNELDFRKIVEKLKSEQGPR